MRTDAMNWFKVRSHSPDLLSTQNLLPYIQLSPAQMDRAFPISANANKYGGITRVYNESDVVVRVFS